VYENGAKGTGSITGKVQTQVDQRAGSVQNHESSEILPEELCESGLKWLLRGKDRTRQTGPLPERPDTIGTPTSKLTDVCFLPLFSRSRCCEEKRPGSRPGRSAPWPALRGPVAVGRSTAGSKICPPCATRGDDGGRCLRPDSTAPGAKVVES